MPMSAGVVTRCQSRETGRRTLEIVMLDVTSTVCAPCLRGSCKYPATGAVHGCYTYSRGHGDWRDSSTSDRSQTPIEVAKPRINKCDQAAALSSSANATNVAWSESALDCRSDE